MAATAKKTNPALWQEVKNQITGGDRGGRPGQWSARKAQLAAREYKKQGGGYQGGKGADNHLQQWTDQQWGTKSGEPSGETAERYLPRRAREQLSDQEYAETTAKKRKDAGGGRQFSAQPAAVARKTAQHRGAGPTTGDRAIVRWNRSELMAKAAQAGIVGRSRMSKAELMKALG